MNHLERRLSKLERAARPYEYALVLRRGETTDAAFARYAAEGRRLNPRGIILARGYDLTEDEWLAECGPSKWRAEPCEA